MKQRKNRFDPSNPDHRDVQRMPFAFNRASRRAAGYRQPVHAEAMQADISRVLPRAVRRLFRDPEKAARRVVRNRAKVERLIAHTGRTINA